MDSEDIPNVLEKAESTRDNGCTSENKDGTIGLSKNTNDRESTNHGMESTNNTTESTKDTNESTDNVSRSTDNGGKSTNKINNTNDAMNSTNDVERSTDDGKIQASNDPTKTKDNKGTRDTEGDTIDTEGDTIDTEGDTIDTEGDTRMDEAMTDQEDELINEIERMKKLLKQKPDSKKINEKELNMVQEFSSLTENLKEEHEEEMEVLRTMLEDAYNQQVLKISDELRDHYQNDIDEKMAKLEEDWELEFTKQKVEYDHQISAVQKDQWNQCQEAIERVTLDAEDQLKSMKHAYERETAEYRRRIQELSEKEVMFEMKGRELEEVKSQKENEHYKKIKTLEKQLSDEKLGTETQVNDVENKLKEITLQHEQEVEQVRSELERKYDCILNKRRDELKGKYQDELDEKVARVESHLRQQYEEDLKRTKEELHESSTTLKMKYEKQLSEVLGELEEVHEKNLQHELEGGKVKKAYNNLEDEMRKIKEKLEQEKRGKEDEKECGTTDEEGKEVKECVEREGDELEQFIATEEARTSKEIVERLTGNELEEKLEFGTNLKNSELEIKVRELSSQLTLLEQHLESSEQENISLKSEHEQDIINLKLSCHDTLETQKTTIVDKEAIVSQQKGTIMEQELSITTLESITSKYKRKISELEQVVADLKTIIGENESNTTEKGMKISKLQEIVKDRDRRVAELESIISEEKKIIAKEEQGMADLEASVKESNISVVELEAKIMKQHIIICEQQETIDENKDAKVSELEFKIKQQKASILEQTKSVELEGTRITNLETMIKDKDEKVCELESKIKEQKEIISEQTREETRITNLQEVIKSKDKMVAQFQCKLSEQEILISEQLAAINDLEKTSSARELEIANLILQTPSPSNEIDKEFEFTGSSEERMAHLEKEIVKYKEQLNELEEEAGDKFETSFCLKCEDGETREEILARTKHLVDRIEHECGERVEIMRREHEEIEERLKQQEEMCKGKVKQLETELTEERRRSAELAKLSKRLDVNNNVINSGIKENVEEKERLSGLERQEELDSNDSLELKSGKKDEVKENDEFVSEDKGEMKFGEGRFEFESKELESLGRIEEIKREYEVLLEKLNAEVLEKDDELSKVANEKISIDNSVELLKDKLRKEQERCGEITKLAREQRTKYEDEIKLQQNEIETLIKEQKNKSDLLEECKNNDTTLQTKVYDLEKVLVESTRRHQEEVQRLHEIIKTNESLLQNFESINQSLKKSNKEIKMEIEKLRREFEEQEKELLIKIQEKTNSFEIEKDLILENSSEDKDRLISQVNHFEDLCRKSYLLLSNDDELELLYGDDENERRPDFQTGFVKDFQWNIDKDDSDLGDMEEYNCVKKDNTENTGYCDNDGKLKYNNGYNWIGMDNLHNRLFYTKEKDLNGDLRDRRGFDRIRTDNIENKGSRALNLETGSNLKEIDGYSWTSEDNIEHMASCGDDTGTKWFVGKPWSMMDKREYIRTLMNDEKLEDSEVTDEEDGIQHVEQGSVGDQRNENEVELFMERKENEILKQKFDKMEDCVKVYQEESRELKKTLNNTLEKVEVLEKEKNALSEENERNMVESSEIMHDLVKYEEIIRKLENGNERLEREKETLLKYLQKNENLSKKSEVNPVRNGSTHDQAITIVDYTVHKQRRQPQSVLLKSTPRKDTTDYKNLKQTDNLESKTTSTLSSTKRFDNSKTISTSPPLHNSEKSRNDIISNTKKLKSKTSNLQRSKTIHSSINIRKPNLKSTNLSQNSQTHITTPLSSSKKSHSPSNTFLTSTTLNTHQKLKLFPNLSGLSPIISEFEQEDHKRMRNLQANMETKENGSSFEYNDDAISILRKVESFHHLEEIGNTFNKDIRQENDASFDYKDNVIDRPINHFPPSKHRPRSNKSYNRTAKLTPTISREQSGLSLHFNDTDTIILTTADPYGRYQQIQSPQKPTHKTVDFEKKRKSEQKDSTRLSEIKSTTLLTATKSVPATQDETSAQKLKYKRISTRQEKDSSPSCTNNTNTRTTNRFNISTQTTKAEQSTSLTPKTRPKFHFRSRSADARLISPSTPTKIGHEEKPLAINFEDYVFRYRIKSSENIANLRDPSPAELWSA